MFSFGKRNEQTEVQRLIRRLMDASAFSHVRSSDEARGENRSSFTMPVLITPCEDDAAILDQSVFGITKDWSSQGVAVIAQCLRLPNTVVLGLLLESRPHFLLGQVRTTAPIGGGFWQLGIEITELLKADSSAGLRELLPLVAQLDPQHSTSVSVLCAAQKASVHHVAQSQNI